MIKCKGIIMKVKIIIGYCLLLLFLFLVLVVSLVISYVYVEDVE